MHVSVFWDFIHQTVYLKCLQIVEKQVAMELDRTQSREDQLSLRKTAPLPECRALICVFPAQARHSAQQKEVWLCPNNVVTVKMKPQQKQDTAAAATLAVPTVLLQGAAASWRFSTACLFHQF
jgi:hypothetical protein